MEQADFNTFDEYFSLFTEDVREKLQSLRQEILRLVPDAQETISYRMPAFRYFGVLVYFAAYRNHIGFYPTASGIAHFQDDIQNFRWSKGAIQFPLDQELPWKLIEKIVLFRAQENRQKAAGKRKL